MMQDGVERIAAEERHAKLQQLGVHALLLCDWQASPQEHRQESNHRQPARAQRRLQNAIWCLLQDYEPADH